MKRMYAKMRCLAAGLQRKMGKILYDEEGMGTVEVILIILVLLYHLLVVYHWVLGHHVVVRVSRGHRWEEVWHLPVVRLVEYAHVCPERNVVSHVFLVALVRSRVELREAGKRIWLDQEFERWKALAVIDII